MTVNPSPNAARSRLLILAVVLGAVAVFAFAMAVVLGGANAPAQTGSYAGIPQGTFEDVGAALIGNPQAKIILAEFSNFSCPGCAQYHSTIKKIIDTHVRNGQAALTYMPMIFQSAPSVIAAQAALCAKNQGKFWEMHDALFALHAQRGPNVFTLELVREQAAALKLEMDAFVACVTDGSTNETLIKASRLAGTLRVQYTPTLVYSLDGGKTWQWFEKDGQKFDSSVPLEVVSAAVEQANRP
jgi:protein-disulfide isomerase